MFSELSFANPVLESITAFDEGSNDSERLTSLSKAKVVKFFT